MTGLKKMVSKAFQSQSRLDDDRTMVKGGLTYVFQSTNYLENVFIMNPNDGKVIRGALVDASPMLLATNYGRGFSYFEDAIVTYHHPHITDPDCVGLYVRDKSIAPLRLASDDFNARRKAVMDENRANGVETYVPQAQKGSAVVSLFKRPAPEIVNG